ncbi:Immunoglobulin [Oryctes borbonicus]|uniref:Immunoglobulin n=1 Tax=Oryctes borbonicus TaxID=1629725 RepID=A0A0T6BDP4_9SCAR|nr:Immunoglobulin [Oryctes borbonicus]
MDDASLPPRFLMQPETVTARDGESAFLKCPVENAENYGQVWLKDQNTIANGNRSMQPDLYDVFPNRTLLVKNVKPSTTGYYSCTIYISNSKKASLTHKLKLENGAEIVSLRAQNNITQ